MRLLLYALAVIVGLGLFPTAAAVVAPHNNSQMIFIEGRADLTDLTSLPSEMFEIRSNVCYLKRPLTVSADSTFNVDDKECDHLKLYPGVYIKNQGSLYFNDMIVQSYDPATGRPIEKTYDTYTLPRPYVTTVYPAKYFYAKNSEFSYLGYYHGEEAGSKWGLSLYDITKGDIINTRLHHNYFGLYTFNVSNLLVADSEVYDNLEYGLDFHDYSDHHVIRNNEIYRNGNHGLIYSKHCSYNLVINNYIRDNNSTVFVKGDVRDYGTHGIMLHYASDHNLIINNTLVRNRVGIYLAESNNNIIQGNLVTEDEKDGLYFENSSNNTVSRNTVYDVKGYSVYSFYSNNTYENNNLDKAVIFKGEYDGVPYSVVGTSLEVNESQVVDDIRAKDAAKLGAPQIVTGGRSNPLTAKIIFIGGLTALVFFIIFIEALMMFARKRRERRDNGS